MDHVKRTGRLVLLCAALALFLNVPPLLAAKGGKGGGRDTTPPAVTIVTPADGSEVYDPSVVVSGTATDDVAVQSATVAVGAAQPLPLALGPDGGFSATVTLMPGDNAVEVTATDGAGNRASAVHAVRYHAPPPVVTITSPADGEVINGGHVDVVGTVEAQVTAFLNPRSFVTLEGGAFRMERYELLPGPNTIEVVGVDGEGRTYPAYVTVECISDLGPIELKANAASGLLPLDASFIVENNTGEQIVSWEMDFEGDGLFEPLPGGADGAAHTYTEGGIYTPEVRATTAAGHQFSAFTVLSAHGPAVLVNWFPVDDPVDLAVDSSGRLFVLERTAARVRVLEESGAITFIGRPGKGNGQFMEPSGIALDIDGNLYVADTGNDRVQKFSPSLQHLATWGYPGSKLGEMRRPTGIAVRYDGEIALVDSGNGRLDFFDGDGNF